MLNRFIGRLFGRRTNRHTHDKPTASKSQNTNTEADGEYSAHARPPDWSKVDEFYREWEELERKRGEDRLEDSDIQSRSGKLEEMRDIVVGVLQQAGKRGLNYDVDKLFETHDRLPCPPDGWRELLADDISSWDRAEERLGAIARVVNQIREPKVRESIRKSLKTEYRASTGTLTELEQRVEDLRDTLRRRTAGQDLKREKRLLSDTEQKLKQDLDRAKKLLSDAEQKLKTAKEDASRRKLETEEGLFKYVRRLAVVYDVRESAFDALRRITTVTGRHRIFEKLNDQIYRSTAVELAKVYEQQAKQDGHSYEIGTEAEREMAKKHQVNLLVAQVKDTEAKADAETEIRRLIWEEADVDVLIRFDHRFAEEGLSELQADVAERLCRLRGDKALAHLEEVLDSSVDAKLKAAVIRRLGDSLTSSLRPEDIVDWPGFLKGLSQAERAIQPSPCRRIWELLPVSIRDTVERTATDGRLQQEQKTSIIEALNSSVLSNRGFYRPEFFMGGLVPPELQRELVSITDLPDYDVLRLNRHLMELVCPQQITKSYCAFGNGQAGVQTAWESRVLQILTHELDSIHEEVRSASAGALSQVPGSEILVQPKHETEGVPEQASPGQVLNHHPDSTIERLVFSLRDGKESVREEAARALELRCNSAPEVRVLLLKSITADAEYARQYSAKLLGNFKEDDTVREVLVTALSDRIAAVRYEAARALEGTAQVPGQKEQERYIWYLAARRKWHELLKSGETGPTREMLLRALRFLLHDREDDVRKNAAELMGKLGEGADDLVIAMSDPNDLVREAAAEAIGQAAKGLPLEGRLRVLSSLKEALVKEGFSIIQQGIERSMESIARSGSRAVEMKELLFGLCSDRSSRVRRFGGRALGISYGLEDTRDVLVRLEEDEESGVRLTAGEALERRLWRPPDRDSQVRHCCALRRWAEVLRLSKKDAVTRSYVLACLGRLMRDKDPKIRERVVRLLGEIGGDDAIPYLRGALGDADAKISRLALRHEIELLCEVKRWEELSARYREGDLEAPILVAALRSCLIKHDEAARQEVARLLTDVQLREKGNAAALDCLAEMWGKLSSKTKDDIKVMARKAKKDNRDDQRLYAAAEGIIKLSDKDISAGASAV